MKQHRKLVNFIQNKWNLYMSICLCLLVCLSLFVCLSVSLHIYIYTYTMASQKFRNILLTCGTIRYLWCFCRAGEVNQPDWNAELAWYSPRATRQIFLYGFEPSLRIHAFRLTWLCLIANVLGTQVKRLDIFCYSSVINCAFIFQAINVFDCTVRTRKAQVFGLNFVSCLAFKYRVK